MAGVPEEESEELMRESFHARQAARDILVGEAMEIGFKPWDDNDEAEDFVKALEPSTLATWGLLYCGGAKQVLKVLEEVSDEYEINLHVESFAW